MNLLTFIFDTIYINNQQQVSQPWGLEILLGMITWSEDQARVNYRKIGKAGRDIAGGEEPGLGVLWSSSVRGEILEGELVDLGTT